MATQRLESGQVQLRGAGGVPMQQVQVPQIDFTASRVEAVASGQLAQALDRMALQVTQDAMQTRFQEGLQFAAENPLTAEQIEAAKNGKPIELGGNKFSEFNRAIRKAHSLELSQHFESEGINQLVLIQNAVESGTMSAEDAGKQIRQITDGMGRTLAMNDGDAAYKFRASMATHGNSVLQNAYKIELNRAKQARIAKLDMTFKNQTRLLEIKATEDPDNFDAHAMLFANDLLNAASFIGDAGIQKEYGGKLDEAIKNAKINAIVKHFSQDKFLADSRGTQRAIEAGVADQYSDMLKKLKTEDLNAWKKVTTGFMDLVKQRKEGVDLALFESDAQGKDILRALYTTTDGAKQRQLLKELQTLPTSPEIQKQARDFVYSDSATGPQVDDLNAFGRLSQRVALGLATQDEVMKAPLTRATKKALMQQWANPTDDVNYGINQINLSVGIQSGNLPPEFKAPETRQLAVETRNSLAMELHNFARTPKDNGMLPSPTEIRNKGSELAAKASQGMSKAFDKAATSNSEAAVLMLPELKGVDLNDDAAVQAAIAKATASKKSQTVINAARASIEDYRANFKKSQEGKQ